MRDPERIPAAMQKLQELWVKNPDMRLGQLIFGLGCRSRQNKPTRSVFHIDDEDMLAEIEEWLTRPPNLKRANLPSRIGCLFEAFVSAAMVAMFLAATMKSYGWVLVAAGLGLVALLNYLFNVRKEKSSRVRHRQKFKELSKE